MGFVVWMVLNYLCGVLAMAFFTLLERKSLGYFQLRKGPNKVGVLGATQPFNDVIKLFAKEQSFSLSSNIVPFFMSPIFGLSLALILWSLYPSSSPTFYMSFGVLFFLCVSSMSVYAVLGSGWSSNSKYALLGAIRSVAQTISYEVSMAIILLSAVVMAGSLSFTEIFMARHWGALMLPPLCVMWVVTMLAETNRTPFDFVEGESEIVSGFNIEYSAGSFALIFMAEYMSIVIMSVFSVVLFTGLVWLSDFFMIFGAVAVSFVFVWVRGVLPRMRYDKLMGLTWKSFLPVAIFFLFVAACISGI